MIDQTPSRFDSPDSCELTQLAVKYSVTKGAPYGQWPGHGYTQHYHSFFAPMRNESLRILEIGVGGYADPAEGGHSLRMWKEYFPKSQIVAIDLYDKSSIEEDRIKIYCGSQTNSDFLTKVNDESGPFDIIIDDGSHINSHVIKSFKVLFPLLKQNGIYVVEDLQTSYWRNYGGNSCNLNYKKTSMNYFKKLLDGVNYGENENPFYQPSYLDKNITEMSFFCNIVFIQKGINARESLAQAELLRRRAQPLIIKIHRYIRKRYFPRHFTWRIP